MTFNPVPRAVAFAVRAPLAVIAVALALVAVAAWYASNHFAMSTDTAQLIAPTVQWRQDEIAVDTAFPQNRDLIAVVVDAGTPEGAEIAAAALADRLAKDRSHFTAVRRPDATPFLQEHGLLLGSTADVQATTAALISAQPFLGPLAADPSLRGVMTSLSTVLTGVEAGTASLADLRRPVGALGTALDRVARGEAALFSWSDLFNSASSSLKPPRRRIIVVQPVLDYAALMPGDAAGDAVRAAAKGLDARVRLTGAVPLADEEFASLADRAWLVGGVMLGSMLTILWLAVRSVRIVAAITLVTLAGLVVTAAIGLAAVGRFNLISVAFIPLFVGLGVDFGIQLSVRFRAEKTADAATALRDAATGLGGALALAALAVALGFAAFLPTAYVGVSELGIIAALGMVVALTLSVTLLPALLVLLKPKPRGETGLRLAKSEAWLLTHRRAVLWAFGGSLAASIALLPLVRFDFNPYHLRDPNGPAMSTLADLMRDPDRTPNTVDILTRDPAGVAARLGRLPAVRQVATLDSFVPGDQPAKLALIADARDLLDLTLNPFDTAPPPTDAETVAALQRTAGQLRTVAKGDAPALKLAAALDRIAHGPPALRARAAAVLVPPLGVLLDQTRALLRAGPVSRATLPPGLRRDWIAADGRDRVQAFPRVGPGGGEDNDALRRFVAAVLSVAPHASGAAVSTQAAAATIARAFVEASVYGLAAISLLLFAVLRSVREVLFTLAPVVLSGFLTLATCVVIQQPINFANIIAFPLLFGVGVAFHIYFVMAWRAGATGLLTSSLARAVLFSALATGCAFGSLWLSEHPGTASMGKILMISLAWTLVCALVFEPALLGPAKESEKA